MKLLAAMLALAVTLMIDGTTEIWEMLNDPPEIWAQTTAAPTPTVEDRACLIVPIHTEDDGDLYLGPESEWILTGGLAIGDIRVGMVGHYLNIAFEQQPLVDSWDMVLSSIDATGLTEATICKPEGGTG